MFLSAAPAPTAPPLRHASGARTVLRRAVPVASDDDEPLRMFLSAAPAPTAPLMRHIVTSGACTVLILAILAASDEEEPGPTGSEPTSTQDVLQIPRFFIVDYQALQNRKVSDKFHVYSTCG